MDFNEVTKIWETLNDSERLEFDRFGREVLTSLFTTLKLNWDYF